MIYTEAEHFIKESHNEVIRLGLGRIEELLERLGCPQKKLNLSMLQEPMEKVLCAP